MVCVVNNYQWILSIPSYIIHSTNNPIRFQVVDKIFHVVHLIGLYPVEGYDVVTHAADSLCKVKKERKVIYRRKLYGVTLKVLNGIHKL